MRPLCDSLGGVSHHLTSTQVVASNLMLLLRFIEMLSWCGSSRCCSPLALKHAHVKMSWHDVSIPNSLANVRISEHEE